MKIGLYFGTFLGGGAERMMINLAKGFSDFGADVELFVVNKTGPYLKNIPRDLSVHSFEAQAGVKSVIPKIRRTLSEKNLTACISTQTHINIAVGLAAMGLTKRPKIIFRQPDIASWHNTFFLKKQLASFFYKRADACVAISQGVKEDLISYYGLDKNKIKVIYNPVVSPELFELAEEEPEHPWFLNKNMPVIIGMGRLVPEKGFVTLLTAFGRVREHVECRLVIFGEKYSQEYYNRLEREIDELGIKEYVDMPGFVSNPFCYFGNADLFALSSQSEGFGNVLVEAMACGCPVVSTDCPSGPREILMNGKYGRLVKVGDYNALAEEMIKELNDPRPKQVLKERASEFTIKNKAAQYYSLIDEL